MTWKLPIIFPLLHVYITCLLCCQWRLYCQKNTLKIIFPDLRILQNFNLSSIQELNVNLKNISLVKLKHMANLTILIQLCIIPTKRSVRMANVPSFIGKTRQRNWDNVGRWVKQILSNWIAFTGKIY